MSDDPSLAEITRSQMGKVSERIKGFSSPKPSAPPRKPRTSYNSDIVQNGNTSVDKSSAIMSSTDVPPTGPKLRVIEKKNKFRNSTPSNSSINPNANGTEPRTHSVGPSIRVMSPELIQSGTLQKAVCVTHDPEFETATEISSRDVSLHITNSSQSSPVSFRRVLSPSSPECLDSSFDEMTSDEDEAANRVMGDQVPLPPPMPEESVEQKPSHVASGRRERASLLIKDISLSPSQKRKHLESLSESFLPSDSPTVSRSQTFNQKSPRQREKMQKHSSTVYNRSSFTTSMDTTPSSTSSFVFVENSNSQVSVGCTQLCAYTIAHYARLILRYRNSFAFCLCCICV